MWFRRVRAASDSPTRFACSIGRAVVRKKLAGRTAFKVWLAHAYLCALLTRGNGRRLEMSQWRSRCGQRGWVSGRCWCEHCDEFMLTTKITADMEDPAVRDARVGTVPFLILLLFRRPRLLQLRLQHTPKMRMALVVAANRGAGATLTAIGAMIVSATRTRRNISARAAAAGHAGELSAHVLVCSMC